jgi:hypothetical protein
MGLFDFFGGDEPSEAEMARTGEMKRQRRIRRGTNKITKLFDNQFNDEFFAGRNQGYIDYALPQLNEQSADATKQLAFSLERRGALDSSSRSGLEAELNKKRALAETGIRDQARDYETEARGAVENTRNGLIDMLTATGDASRAVNNATTQASLLSKVPAYNPISSLFADFTAGLGANAAAERAFSYGAGPRPAVSTGLFGPRSGSVVNY